VKVPCRQLPGFGRLAYPGLGEVTNQELFGWKSHSRYVNIESHGGDDLSGEQTHGPEANDCSLEIGARAESLS